MSYEYSWLTEVIVVATWGLAPWFAFIALRESGRPLSVAWTVFAVSAAWAVYAWLSVRVGLFSGGTGILTQARPVVILVVGLALTLAFARWIIGPCLSQRWLISLQLFRAIGLVFVLEWSRGNLPGVFAHPAGWGDLAAALTAAVVLIVYRRRAIPPAAVYTVAAVGIADAVSAFFFGFLSSPTELQLFALDNPNRVIAYPTGLIPMFLIVFAVLFHILSLTELHRSQRAARATSGELTV